MDEIDEEDITSICDKLLEAYKELSNGRVLISPTPVGYTLITTEAGAKKMKSIKGRPSAQPCGLLGNNDIYKATFNMEPPLEPSINKRYILGHMGKPKSLPSFIPEDAVGANGEVGIWLENGLVVDFLAAKLWSESRDVIIASSCNMAGEGNPKSDHYDLSFVHPNLRNDVQLEIGIPHWGKPQLDADGRWLSAPIWEIGTDNFLRVGRDFDAVSKLVRQNKVMAG